MKRFIATCVLPVDLLPTGVIALLIATWGSPAVHAELILDDFSTPQSLNMSGGFVNGPGIYGGDRDVGAFGGAFEVASGVMTATAATSDNFVLVYDGPNSSLGEYYGLPPIDLPATGDRFAFDVLSMSGAVEMRVLLVSGNDTGRTFIWPRIPVTGPGVFEVPLSQLNNSTGSPDLTDIRAVVLDFAMDPGHQFR